MYILCEVISELFFYLQVIAKFIRKSDVYKELWVYDNQQNKKVPLEISLLTTIQHPNIVKVSSEVFELTPILNFY